MIHIDLFREAGDVFAKGGNVVRHFKDRGLSDEQQIAVIEFAYDLQAGSYTAALETSDATRSQKTAWGGAIAEILNSHGVTSAVEAGTGEATTLKFIVDNLDRKTECAGFDLSISRLLYARRLTQNDANPISLFTGDLTAIPLVDDAYDVVLTNHSIESNGGRERVILAEMLRATRKLLVLVEPDFERGGPEQRERMTSLGYIRDLPGHLEALGAKILEYREWEHNPVPLNAASLIVAEKPQAANWNAKVGQVLASPYSKTALAPRDHYLYSDVDSLAFPIIEGVPCLLRSNAVMASHLSASRNDDFR